MLKIHVKLLSKVLLINLRDMEVGMVYKGNKGLPKIVVHKTSKTAVVRNVGEEKVMTVCLSEKSYRQTRGSKPMKVFAVATNNDSDVKKLVKVTASV